MLVSRPGLGLETVQDHFLMVLVLVLVSTVPVLVSVSVSTLVVLVLVLNIVQGGLGYQLLKSRLASLHSFMTTTTTSHQVPASQ